MAMKILLVEDDRMFAMMHLNHLGRRGYKIACAFDGTDALEQLRESRFDLVVTDLVMPGKEGIDVIQETKDKSPQTKILAISSAGAVGHSSYLDLARTYGADACLAKPFTPEQILREIKDLTHARHGP